MTTHEAETRLIKHEWWQVGAVIIAVFTMFMWMRTESRNDYRDLKHTMESNFSSFRDEMRDFRQKWAEESREFHGRLIAIEERMKKND